MILPTKGVPPHRALISVGAGILGLLAEPKTVSRLWDEYCRRDEAALGLTFDWFVHALDLLFVMGTVEYEAGRIRRVANETQP